MSDVKKTKQELFAELHKLRARVEELELSQAGALGRDDTRTALREQQTLIDNIIRHIPCGVFWKDRQCAYLGCNEAFARKAGVPSPAHIIGKTDYDLPWRKEEADYFRKCDRQVMEENTPLLNVEEAERQADGRQAIILTNKVPLHDSEKHVWGVLGIDIDITEYKRIETQLRKMRDELEDRVQQRTAELAEANQRYRLVSELTSDYAYALRVFPDGMAEVEWVTDAYARITGFSVPKQKSLVEWESLVYSDDRPIMEKRRQNLLAGQSHVCEFRIVTAAGKTRWLRDYARPIPPDRECQMIRILGAAQDITERKLAEEEASLREAKLLHVARLATMGEMAAALAHEINQPLCAIVSNSQAAQRLLERDKAGTDELRSALADIVTDGKMAGEIIHRLRDFLRRKQARRSLLNVKQAIEAVTSLLEADARRHNARIQINLADDLPPIRGDSVQIQQVVLNLVRNGLESMSEHEITARDVTIRAYRHNDDSIVLDVIDNGSGFSPETEKQLFEPFFTTKPAGLGMGLSICKSIMESHGGELKAILNVDRGSTFRCILPRAKASPEL